MDNAENLPTAKKSNTTLLIILANILVPGSLALLTASLLVACADLIGISKNKTIEIWLLNILLHFTGLIPIFGLAINILPHIAKKTFDRFYRAKTVLDIFIVLWVLPTIWAVGLAIFNEEFNPAIFSIVIVTLAIAAFIAYMGYRDNRAMTPEPSQTSATVEAGEPKPVEKQFSTGAADNSLLKKILFVPGVLALNFAFCTFVFLLLIPLWYVAFPVLEQLAGKEFTGDAGGGGLWPLYFRTTIALPITGVVVSTILLVIRNKYRWLDKISLGNLVGLVVWAVFAIFFSGSLLVRVFSN